ncbi:MAG: MerR family transcriptional regulator [Nitrospirae bacterium]|nr:MerR family transcriptional regulator [Nitrospirota bacterium]
MPKKMGTKSVCEKVGISPRQLEYWVLIGVVKPKTEPHGTKIFRKFSEEDIYLLKRVKNLTDEGVLVSRAAEKVKRTTGVVL